MGTASFKAWYMDLYWQFDNLFLISAQILGISYHEFVLISLCIVWPLLTAAQTAAIILLWHRLRSVRQCETGWSSLDLVLTRSQQFRMTLGRPWESVERHLMKLGWRV
jgi:hypothetical protein